MVSVLAVSITIGTPDSARICAADVDAVDAREHQVEQHEVGLVLPERRQSAVTVGAEERFEALTAQHDAQHLGQCCVVVDDEHASPHVFHRDTPGAALRP